MSLVLSVDLKVILFRFLFSNLNICFFSSVRGVSSEELYKKDDALIDITTFSVYLNSSDSKLDHHMSNFPLSLYFCFPRDYDSLRKEDVFENNRLVRCQVVEPLSH